MGAICYAHERLQKIKFEIVVPTPHGAIYACYFCCGHELGVIGTQTKTKMSFQHAQKLLSHCDKETT